MLLVYHPAITVRFDFRYTGYMNSFVLTLRAIGSALAMRLFIPIVAIVGVWFVLFYSLAFWLTTLSDWWWLLLIPLTSLLCIALAAGFVVLSLIRYVRPAQTKAQKQAVGRFIGRVQGVAEVAGTPKFLILFRVIRSIASPSKDTYLSELVKNKELASDFRALQRSFDGEIVIE